MDYSPSENNNTEYGSIALGAISLICGILSIITIGSLIVPEIVSIVCGLFSVNRDAKSTKLGIGGFVCGIIGASMFVVSIIIVLI